MLLSNGNLISHSGKLPGTRPALRRLGTIRIPKPSYLFALVGGKLACVEDQLSALQSGPRTSTLRIYVERGKEDRCGCADGFAQARDARWDEERMFGREYDLDMFMIVAVSDFNMGAMENKGLNVFNDKYVLASPATATDSRFRQYRGDRRARGIFPQLDRQPHHPPRLVSRLCLEGRG